MKYYKKYLVLFTLSLMLFQMGFQDYSIFFDLSPYVDEPIPGGH